MFIKVVYRDSPELSNTQLDAEDLAVEKTLLVNPDCYVRIMLEYIRKSCRLGMNTQFDLCDNRGGLMGLFDLETFTYATNLFDHKKTYYIIVLRQELHINEKRMSVLPQLNRDNRMYQELKGKVSRFMLTGEVSSAYNTPQAATPQVGKKKK